MIHLKNWTALVSNRIALVSIRTALVAANNCRQNRQKNFVQFDWGATSDFTRHKLHLYSRLGIFFECLFFPSNFFISCFYFRLQKILKQTWRKYLSFIYDLLLLNIQKIKEFYPFLLTDYFFFLVGWKWPRTDRESKPTPPEF